MERERIEASSVAPPFTTAGGAVQQAEGLLVLSKDLEPSHIGMMTRIPSHTFPYLNGHLRIPQRELALTQNCSNIQHLAIARIEARLRHVFL